MKSCESNEKEDIRKEFFKLRNELSPTQASGTTEQSSKEFFRLKKENDNE